MNFLIISVQNNCLTFSFDDSSTTHIKLVGSSTKIYPIENKMVTIEASELNDLTENTHHFIEIFLQQGDEWLAISPTTSDVSFIGRTEITDGTTTFSCYIGGDNKVRINNEGFISNKTILKTVDVKKATSKGNKLELTISLTTKHFIPTEVQVILKNRKSPKEIKQVTTTINVITSEKAPNSKAMIHHVEAICQFNKEELLDNMMSLDNPKETFFNWLDAYYNFKVAEFTSSDYAFRLPTKIKEYADDVFVEANDEETILLKPYGTEKNNFSLAYYLYQTEELSYFRNITKDKESGYVSTTGKPIIIVGEYAYSARDNGLAMFKHLMTHHKDEFTIFYAISKNSPDLNNLSPFKDHVLFIGSKEHCDYFLKANVIIHSHFSFYLCPFATSTGLSLIKEKDCYFIQHGVTLQKDVSTIYSYDNGTFFDHIVTSSKRENDLIESKYNYPKSKVLEYGLPRFDALFPWQEKVKKALNLKTNQHVFAFFTWRSSLNNLSFEDFSQTEYYQNLFKFLNDPFWKSNFHLALTIRLHPNLEKYAHLLHSTHPNVTISTEDDPNSVQHYIIHSDIMITDYSSAALDFGIMSKQVIYFLGLAENKSEDISYQSYLPGHIIYHYENLLSLLNTLTKQKRYTREFSSKLDDIYLQRDNKACARLVNHIKNNTKRS